MSRQRDRRSVGAADPVAPVVADPVAPADDPVAPADDPVAPVVARARYMMGENAARSWSRDQAAAWEGLLEVASRLRRGAEAKLDTHDDLSVSMLGVMGRLTAAERHTLRQTALADAMGLSVSRVSRIIDILERRGLVKRTPCPLDGRATNVTLTSRGGDVTRAAQDDVFAFVEGSFFAALRPEEVGTLAGVFRRLLSAGAGARRDRDRTRTRVGS